MAVVRRLQAVVETDGVSRFETSMASARSALTQFKRTVGLTGGALAALAGGAMVAAVNEARKFQSAMVEVEKVTNPQTANEMSDAIKRMAETIPLAQKELATIAADAGRFGVEGSKNIEKFTKSTAKMATATNLNAKEAGEAFARLATLTNTPISKVENLGSSINALSNNFATSAQEIVDSMMRSAGAMSQFGLTQTEIAGFSAALNEVSESSERAGTRLRRLTQEIMNPKKTQDLANALGYSVEAFKDIKNNNPTDLLKQMASAMKGGGRSAKILNKNLSTTSRQALAGLGQNLDGLNESLQMSRKEFKKNTSLQKEFDAAIQTLDKQLKLLLNSFRNVAISMGNVFLPAVTQAVKGIRGLVEGFTNLNKATNGVLAPALTLSTFIVGITAAITTFSGVLGTALTVIGAVGASLVTLAGPIAGLTLAIMGLYKAWKTNFAGIRSVVVAVFDIVADRFNIIFNKIKEVSSLIVNDLLGAFRTGTGGIEKQIAGLVSTIKTVFLQWFINDFVVPIMDGLRKVEKLWIQHRSAVISAIKGFVSQLKGAFSGAISFVVGLWRRFGDDIIGIIRNKIMKYVVVIQSILDMAMSVWKKHGDGVINTIDIMVKLLQQSFNWLKKNVLPIVLDFLGLILKEWRRSTRKIIKAWNMIKGPLKTVVMAIADFIAITFRELGPLIHKIVVGIGKVWRNQIKPMLALAKRVFNTIRSIVTRVFNRVRKIVNTVTNTVSNVWRKNIQPMLTTARNVFNKIRNIITRVVTSIRKIWRNNVRPVEKETTSTFNKVRNKIRSVLNFIQNKIIRPVLNWINKQWKKHGTVIVKEAQLTWNAIKYQINRVGGIIQGIVNKITGFITKIWNKFGSKLVKESKKTWNAISFQVNRIIGIIRKEINKFTNFITKIWNKFGRKLVKEATKAWNGIKQAVMPVINWLKPFIRGAINVLSTMWNKFMGTLETAADMAWNAIKTVIGAVITGIKTIITEYISFVITAWKSWGDELISVAKFIFDTIKGTIEHIINTIRAIVVTVLRLLRGDVDGALKEIDRYFTSTFNGIKGFLDKWGGRLMGWARGTFNDVKSTILGTLRGLKREGTSAIDSMLSSMKSAASSWISNFTKPFRKAKDRVLEQFNKLKDKVVGNSIVPDMLGMIQDETGDWKGSFQGDFQAAAEGSKAAMKGMPDDLELPTPGSSKRRSKSEVKNNTVNIDVTVPQGVDTDTAARTIADEVKSRAFND